MKKVREGYKMTELGEIPDEWNCKNLKQICYIKGRIGWQGLRQEEFTDVGPYLITGINFDRGKIIWDECYHITEKRYNEAKEIQLKVGDVLMTKDGTVGKLLYVENLPDKASLNSHLFVMRPYDNSFFPKYLYYHLDSRYFKKYVRKNQTGSTIPAITQEAMERYPLVLPPINEQKKISSILSSVDEQIEITDNLIEKTKKLKKGLMQKLLTEGIGHSRFKETEIGRIPEEWEVKKLSDIADIIMGQSPDSSSYNKESEGIPFFQGKTEFGAIYPIVRKWCAKPTKIAQPFDILISVRAPVGDVNINLIQSCIGRGLGAIRETDKSYYEYIFYVLQVYSKKLKKSSQGSTFEAINSSDLKMLKLPVPLIEEQKKISLVLSSVDDQISQYESKKEKLQELKKGLMQKLLTGKIRVKVN